MSVLLHVPAAQRHVAVPGLVYSRCVLTGEADSLKSCSTSPTATSCLVLWRLQALSIYLGMQGSASQEIWQWSSCKPVIKIQVETIKTGCCPGGIACEIVTTVLWKHSCQIFSISSEPKRHQIAAETLMSAHWRGAELEMFWCFYDAS